MKVEELTDLARLNAGAGLKQSIDSINGLIAEDFEDIRYLLSFHSRWDPSDSLFFVESKTEHNRLLKGCLLAMRDYLQTEFDKL